jgi:lipoprotein-anchoring transpeptidase ErfK/SrfK
MKKRIYLVLTAATLIAVIWIIVNSVSNRGTPGPENRPGSPMMAKYRDAKSYEAKGSYLEARRLYREILENAQDERMIAKTQESLKDLSMKMLLSPVVTEDSAVYVVEKGDTLGKIARQFGTTVGLIMRSNNLESDIIRPGQRLKVSKADYSVLVDYSDNTLELRSDSNILKTYKVATGIDNSTPLGTFKVVNKLKDPVWYKAGAVVPSGSPENILGTRWMGLSVAGYGIHGTTQPESIGKHVTAGCVRMRMEDVEELYDILPVGAEVVIAE